MAIPIQLNGISRRATRSPDLRISGMNNKGLRTPRFWNRNMKSAQQNCMKKTKGELIKSIKNRTSRRDRMAYYIACTWDVSGRMALQSHQNFGTFDDLSTNPSKISSDCLIRNSWCSSHARTHFKPVVCKCCGDRFAQVKGFKEHYSSTHGSGGGSKCEYCDKWIRGKKFNMKRHQESKNGCLSRR